jgi:hypothetical protein
MFPSYIVSTDFHSHFREPDPVCPTVRREESQCLLLRVFTLPSIPGKNPLTLVFKVLRDVLVFAISHSDFTLVRLYLAIEGHRVPQLPLLPLPTAEADGVSRRFR